MKRCLNGWIFSSYNFRSKLEIAKVNKISDWMVMSNKHNVTEFRRPSRAVSEIGHWKSIEFRNFLLYFGPVVLKDVLKDDMYTHFLYLSCAVRIISCDNYVKNSQMKSVAGVMLIQYIEKYKELYGEDAINNNVHDLCHVMDDIERFGSLRNISAYPFESTLFTIKNLLYSTAKPLIQVANRIIEKYNLEEDKITNKHAFPILEGIKKNVEEFEAYSKIKFDSYFLATNDKDKFFYSVSKEVIAMDYAVRMNDDIFIYGKKVKRLNDFFKQPFPSSLLNIFQANIEYEEQKMYHVREVRCKMVGLKSHNVDFIFLPLIHSF